MTLKFVRETEMGFFGNFLIHTEHCWPGVYFNRQFCMRIQMHHANRYKLSRLRLIAELITLDYSTTPSAVILTLRFEYVRDVIYIFLKFHRQTPSLGTQGQLAGVNVRADFAAVLCLLFVTPAGVFKY